MKQFKVLLFAVLLMPFLTTAQTKQQLQTQSTSSAKLLIGQTLTRGVNYDTFRAVSGLTDTSLNAIASVAWQLWKMEQWATLETLFFVNDLNDSFPPNNGGTYSKLITLDSGVMIDRYGGKITNGVFSDDWGQFVAPEGEPFNERSLPASYKTTKPYRVYRIIKPIASVNEGRAIPWFSMVGLGIQYQLPYTIKTLLQKGYIVNIPDVTQPQ